MTCCCEEEKNRIIIVHGNDTNYNNIPFLTLRLTSEVWDLSTMKATLTLGGITKEFNDLSSGIIQPSYTAEETSKMPFGNIDGVLKVYNESEQVATIESLLPFRVIGIVHGDAIAVEPFEYTINVEQAGQNVLNISVEASVSIEIVGTVTVPATEQARVENIGTPEHMKLVFYIPRGINGSGAVNDVEVDGQSVLGLDGIARIDSNTLEVKATGTSAERTLADRFADVVNVKDFGAVGDGTTDDTTAINAAYDDAYTKSTRVFFPAGTYLTNGNIVKFYNVQATGDGIIKRGPDIFSISCDDSDTNNLYVSPTGTGDGLSSAEPAGIDNVISLLKQKSPLKGTWNIKLASGEYSGGIMIKDISVLKEFGLVISGEEPQGGVWGTKITLPTGSTANYCIACVGVDNVLIKNLWCDSNHDTNNTHCIYFRAGCDHDKVLNCYLTNCGGGGVTAQMNGLIQVLGCTIDCDTANQTTNYGYGIYCYYSVMSTLITGLRNTIKNCQRGIYVTGNSYFHNDHNDFTNCTNCVVVAKNSYCGWNDCTYTNCGNTVMRSQGSSVLNIDDKSVLETETNRVFILGNTTTDGDSSDLMKEGFYYPDRGPNGAWCYGFSGFAPNVVNIATFNLSTGGEPCTRTGNMNKYGVLVQSVDTRASLILLSKANALVTAPRIEFADESNTYQPSSIIYSGGSLGVRFGNETDYYFKETEFVPVTTDTIALGSSSKIWSAVYAATPDANDSSNKAATTEWVVSKISVKDVTMDGTSIVNSSGVAVIPKSQGATYGVVRTGTKGVGTTSNGELQIIPASTTQIDYRGGNMYAPITCTNFDYILSKSIVSNTQTLDAAGKTAACAWLGAAEAEKTDTLESMASITLADNTVYSDGGNGVSSLTVAMPTTYDTTFVSTVNFTSGNTPTTYSGTGIYHKGDDCSTQDYSFTPVLNKRYTVVYYYDGVAVWGIVKGD